MKIGLVGFAGSGKTTVFNTLTGLRVPTGFGGSVHLGTVKVPDERIDRLSAIFKPKKTVDRGNFLRRINEDPSVAFRLVETMSRRIRGLSAEVVRLKAARTERGEG